MTCTKYILSLIIVLHNTLSLGLEAKDQVLAKQILQETNKFRLTQKLKPLQWNEHLAQIAYNHAWHMSKGLAEFNHDGFENRAKNAGDHATFGENLYMSNDPHQLPAKTVKGWINSPGHRENLVGDFKECGIGVCKSANGYWYVTQLLMRKPAPPTIVSKQTCLQYAKNALMKINEVRFKKGLPSMQWNEQLAQLAQQHSMSMGQDKVPFGHMNFEEHSDKIGSYRRVAAAFYKHNKEDANVQEVIEEWVQGKTRENILGEYTQCGIGVYYAQDGLWYFTQIGLLPQYNYFQDLTGW